MNEIKYWFAINPVAKKKSWGAVLFLGVLYLAAGILVVRWPEPTAMGIIFLLGSLLIVIGLERLLMPLAGKRKIGVWGIFMALVTFGLGGAIIWHPLTADWFLGLMIGCWIFLSGIDALAGAVAAPKGAPGRGLLFFNSIISLLCGVFVVAMPFFGMLLVAFVFGCYLIFAGLIGILGAFELRRRSAPLPAN